MAGLLDFAQAASNSAAGNVAGPIDMLAWGLRKMGLPIPNDPVLGTEWMKQKGLIKEVPQSPASLAGETLGLLSPIVAAAKAPQIAGGLLQMGDNLTTAKTLGAGPGGGQRGAFVYHGSPYIFRKFDASKIGTGEGAQAYGDGFYLAEAKDLADVYRKKLTGIDGAAVAHPDNSLQVKIGQLQSQIQQLRQSDNPAASSMIRAYESRIAELNNVGSLYKVDLPDEHIARMLNWDKPLSQQAPEVQKALQSMTNDVSSGGFDLSRANRDIKKAFSPTTKEQVLKEIATEYPHLKIDGGGLVYKSGARVPDDAITEWMQNKHGIGYQDAGQLYRDLTHIVGSDSYVSSVLKNNGIPGIRYLDGGSRGAGQGTSNFVVFPGNEGLLTILERNGVPLR